MIIIFVGLAQPYVEKRRNNMVVMNECFTMMCVYHFGCFTDFVDSPEAIELVGFSLNSVLVISMLTNVSISLADSFLSLKHRL